MVVMITLGAVAIIALTVAIILWGFEKQCGQALFTSIIAALLLIVFMFGSQMVSVYVKADTVETVESSAQIEGDIVRTGTKINVNIRNEDGTLTLKQLPGKTEVVETASVNEPTIEYIRLDFANKARYIWDTNPGYIYRITVPAGHND